MILLILIPNSTSKICEYIIPANENQALFLMTNFIKTHQTKGFCDEVSARK